MSLLERGCRRLGSMLDAWFILCLVLVGATGVWGQETSGDDQAVSRYRIEKIQPEVESRTLVFGLEAYREVMATGKYLVGPGDEFMVYLSGTEGPYFSKVLSEGGLFIPEVGMVAVGGLRIKEVHDKVTRRFREVMKVGEIELELSQPRQFPLSIVGLVANPGVIVGTGVERASQILDKAGGLQGSASSRNIRIVKTAGLDRDQRAEIENHISAGRFEALIDLSVASIDLVRYKLTGDSQYNPFVEDGDLILVPPRFGQVASFGAVQRPAFYELLPGDRISDLMLFSMGPNRTYDESNVVLFRYLEDLITRISIDVDLSAVLAGDPEADMILEPDDWLNVRAIPEYHLDSQVFISGEVRYPGHYIVGQEGISLDQLITLAGGFTKNASLAQTRIKRQKFIGEGSEGDPEFERLRFVPIGDRSELDDQYFIMKSREKPGQMSVDLVEFYVKGNEAHNITLLPGDVIVVPTRQRTVTVSGAVAQPGEVIFDPDFSVRDYIDRTGGFGWRASKDVMVIKALSGEKKRVKDVVEIQPGDRIWIRERPERDYWTIFTQTMSVVGEVATVVLLVASLTSN